jgi:hypothetical protein
MRMAAACICKSARVALALGFSATCETAKRRGLDSAEGKVEGEVEEESEEGGAAASSGNGHDPETDDDHTGPSLQAEKAKIVQAWNDASSGAKLEFVRERWDEISTVRKQLDAVEDEDRWIEGDDVR